MMQGHQKPSGVAGIFHRVEGFVEIREGVRVMQQANLKAAKIDVVLPLLQYELRGAQRTVAVGKEPAVAGDIDRPWPGHGALPHCIPTS